MTTTSRRALVSLVTLLIVCGTSGAEAQGAGPVRRTEVGRRNDCRLAAQVLEAGEPATKYDWALDAIGWCHDQGGAALAAAWASPPTDRRRLGRLVHETERLADRRTADALIRIAQSGAQPRRTRFAALAVLANYVDSTVFVRPERLVSPDGGVLSVRTHGFQQPGSEPLTTADRTRIVAAVRALGDGDPDAGVKAAAHVLGKQLDARLTQRIRR